MNRNLRAAGRLTAHNLLASLIASFVYFLNANAARAGQPHYLPYQFTTLPVNLAPVQSISGLAVDKYGHVCFSSTYGGVWRFEADSSLTLVTPTMDPCVGLTFDQNGNFYTTEWLNNYTVAQIIKVNVSGTATVVGTYDINLTPYGTAVGPDGTVYLSTGYAGQIWKMSSSGVFSVFAGQTNVAGANDGTGTQATLYLPMGLAISPGGELYVGESNVGLIRKITSAGVVTTVTSGSLHSGGYNDGPLASALFKDTHLIAFDGGGNLFVADDGNFVIRMISTDGTVSTIGGTAGTTGSTDGIGSSALFEGITFIAADAVGNVYIVDPWTKVLKKGVPWSGSYINTQPASETISAGSTVTLSVAAVGTPAPTYQWYFNNSPISGATASSYTIASAQSQMAGNYSVVVSNPTHTVTSDTAILTVALVAPTITLQPAPATVQLGSGTTLSVQASGTSPFTYQWYRNGTAITGATAASYTINSAQASDVGTYTVVVTNGAGSVTSSSAAVTQGVLLPNFTQQPASVDAQTGSSVKFSVLAQNTTSYQWFKNGVAIDGASANSFSIANVQGADAGVYTVTASGPGGSITSADAVLTVAAQSAKLANISTRSFTGSGDSVQIAGFIIGGSTAKKILIRAYGESLAQYGVTGYIADPVLTLYSGSNVIAENDDWGTKSGEVTAATVQANAVAFPNNSKDSALVATLAPGGYTAMVRGKGGESGVTLVEVYEVDSSDNGARLINISTRAEVKAGSQVAIAGLIVTGNSPKKVLIRACGPALLHYGLSSALADPVLTLYRGQTEISSNDDWGKDHDAVASSSAACGAAAFAEGSKDAAIATTLDPGGYTAIIAGKDGTSGIALVEVYEVP